ncbi:MAG: PIG-L family deacetylase [Anaerolineales bacterium]|nr:PIG-L family deacetylase [Anaerolineales bacterium]MCX7756003.1 PIG-L family deacetylase [Anaerolineales bacterium]MDW8277011.1 PIG-L deacetylase family protein [Anaerolineales bacterium]
MNEATEYIPRRAMSIHAHPDDQEFTVGGTLAKWARAGCEIVAITITSGDSGCNDPARDASYKPELAKIREAEQLAANAVLGIREAVFLRYPDGELEATLALRKELTRLIRLYRPDVIVTGDPQGVFYGNGYINHPDHRAAAQAALYATFPSAGTRLIFTDLLEAGYEPHNVKRVYVHGAEKPDTWIDISDTIHLKIEALKKHVSQLGDWDPTETIQKWAEEDGRERGLRYSESFKVMVLVEEDASHAPGKD